MAGSTKDDYLLRQTQMVIEAVARALGKATAGALEATRAELTEAGQLLLGNRIALIDRLDAATAAGLLNDPAVIGAYAELTLGWAVVAGLEGEVAKRERLTARSDALRAQAERRP